MDEPKSTLTAFYDLRVCPPHFDFVTFMAIADATREDYGCDNLRLVIVPDRGTGLHCEAHRYDYQFPADHVDWRLLNIMLPAAALFPKCNGLSVCLSRDEAAAILASTDGPVYPQDYNLDAPPENSWALDEMSMLANLGFELSGIHAPAQALAYVDQWIAQRAGGKKVVAITLREGTHNDIANSNVANWVDFALSLDREVFFPVILPDIERALERDRPDLKGIAQFTEAVFNLLIRAAFYERCYLSMTVATGPSELCWFNGKVRYIMVKAIPFDQIGASLPFSIWLGLDEGEQYPFATPYQRRVEATDSRDVIESEFYAMTARIEGNPIDAFRRHKLALGNPSSANIDRVSRLYWKTSHRPQAAIICQRWLKRHPGDIDVIKTLVETDLQLTHASDPTFARSGDIYRQHLVSHPEDFWARLALAKVNVILDSSDALPELGRVAASLENDGLALSVGDNQRIQTILSRVAPVLVSRGLVDKAERVLRIALTISRSASLEMQLAMILQISGKLDEANDLFVGLLKRGVQSPVIYENLARISQERGDLRAAADYLEEAHALASEPR